MRGIFASFPIVADADADADDDADDAVATKHVGAHHVPGMC